MKPNLYLHEQLLEERRRDLRREMERRRMLARLPRQRSLSRRAVGKLGVLLLKLGMWLKQLEQQNTRLEN